MTKPNCQYCGNNQVPHWVHWYFESMDILAGPMRRLLLNNSLAVWMKKKASEAGLGVWLAKFFLALGILSQQPDPSQCKVRRAQVLWLEGQRRGVSMSELLLFGKAFDCYLARFTARANPGVLKELLISGLPRPSGFHSPSLDLMDDKAAFKRIMEKAGLPVPLGGSAWTFRQALKIFRQIQKSQNTIRQPADKNQTNYKFQFSNTQAIIVKPRAGSRGRHTTSFIRTQAELKKAFAVAKRLCFWVMVEEQLFGPVYRATVIDFKVEGVLRGDPPQVVGDGSSTVKQLIDFKNQLPHQGVSDFVPGLDTEQLLARQLRLDRKGRLLSKSPLDFVPASGQVLNLSGKIGVGYGGSSSEDFDICHSDNKQLFERAARALGDPLVGFDFIIPDIARSWKEQRCGFLEANSLPFINLHHDPLRGKPRNVAAAVWQMAGW